MEANWSKISWTSGTSKITNSKKSSFSFLMPIGGVTGVELERSTWTTSDSLVFLTVLPPCCSLLYILNSLVNSKKSYKN